MNQYMGIKSIKSQKVVLVPRARARSARYCCSGPQLMPEQQTIILKSAQIIGIAHNFQRCWDGSSCVRAAMMDLFRSRT